MQSRAFMKKDLSLPYAGTYHVHEELLCGVRHGGVGLVLIAANCWSTYKKRYLLGIPAA